MSYQNSVSPIWLRQVATALSSRYNVQIREGKGWAMDIEGRTMYYKPEHLLALDRDTCLGILLHELGHLHFTKSDWTVGKLFEQYPEITKNAVNAYEDVRINEKMSQSYMGSRDLIEAMNELLAGDGVSQVMKMDKDVRGGQRQRSGFNMPEWFEVFYISMTKLLGDDLFPQILPDMFYDEKKMNIINEIVREAELRDLKNMDTTDEVYKFVEEVVFPKIGDYLPTPAPDSGQGDGKGSKKAGESEKADAGKGNSVGTEKVTPDSDGDTDSEDGQEDENAPEGGESGGDGDKKDDEKPKKEVEASKRGGNSGVGGDSWKREIESKVKHAIRRGRVNPDKNHQTKPYDRNGNTLKKQYIAPTCNVDKHMETSEGLARQFKNKFEVVFRDNQYGREQTNQRSGRINKRSLYKARLGKTRLFKRKIEVTKKDYAVGFALDLSGSMSGRQVEGSFQAMLGFCKTLELFNVKHGVSFFSSQWVVGKMFDMPMVNKKMSIQASSINNGGTRVNELIEKFFGQELVKQKAKEKIAIILTDGMWNWGCYESLKKLKHDNPTMHIYVIPLMLHEGHHAQLEQAIENNATILHADTPEEIMDKYIQIAKKHLI